jgi:pimeloyl-ACP methyl ester carboxylesterase
MAERRERARQVYERAKAEVAEEEALHGGFVTTPNVRMHYLDRGPKDALALIWAHGTTTSAHDIDEIVDGLVAAPLRVISIDYYGHGLTPIPDHPVSVYHVADDIAFLMDQLDIDRAIIGGWSRGATISSAFYQTYPERTIALILEDGGVVPWAKAYEDTIWELVSRAPEVYEPDGFASEFDLVLSLDADSLLNLNPVEVHRTLGKGLQPAPDGLWYDQPGLIRWLWEDTREHRTLGLREPQRSPLFQRSTVYFEPEVALRNLAVPLLTFDPVSQNDFHRMTEGNQALAARLPHLVTHLIYEDTMHWVRWQRPQRFLRDVLAFVETVR